VKNRRNLAECLITRKSGILDLSNIDSPRYSAISARLSPSSIMAMTPSWCADRILPLKSETIPKIASRCTESADQNDVFIPIEVKTIDI
jgi:hypothetical protein